MNNRQALAISIHKLGGMNVSSKEQLEARITELEQELKVYNAYEVCSVCNCLTFAPVPTKYGEYFCFNCEALHEFVSKSLSNFETIEGIDDVGLC
jgi:formamidopyrimidine-DNA glycosylase